MKPEDRGGTGSKAARGKKEGNRMAGIFLSHLYQKYKCGCPFTSIISIDIKRYILYNFVNLCRILLIVCEGRICSLQVLLFCL